MRKQSVFKRFLIVFAFVIFPFTGYLTVSHVTSCQAQCSGSCGGKCIASGSLVADLQQIYSSVIQKGITTGNPNATHILILYFEGLYPNVYDGMQSVMDRSFREIFGWFNTFWYYTLLPSWQTLAGELDTANVEQTFALGSFADAANIIRNQGRAFGGCDTSPAGVAAGCNKDVFGGDLGIKDHREQRPSEQVCSAGTMMSSMERANSFSNAFNGAAALEKLSIASNFAGGNSANGYAEFMCNRWQNNKVGCDTVTGTTSVGKYGYVPQWCNASFNGGHAGCTADGNQAGPGATSEDVDVAGMIFAQDTIPLDNGQDSTGIRKRSMDQIVTNLAESFVKDPVTADPKKGGGQEGILQSVSYKAKRQVVYDGLYYIISRRVPAGLRSNPSYYSQSAPGGMPPPTGGQPDYAALLKEIRAETGEDASTGCGGGVARSPCPSPYSNPSRNEILRAMMTQRYQSGKYALRGIDEPENNQREQVVEQALQLMQMSDQMELMDHYALLLASQISTEIVAKTNFTQAAEGAPLQ